MGSRMIGVPEARQEAKKTATEATPVGCRYPMSQVGSPTTKAAKGVGVVAGIVGCRKLATRAPRQHLLRLVVGIVECR